jgi:hypothetical protein
MPKRHRTPHHVSVYVSYKILPDAVEKLPEIASCVLDRSNMHDSLSNKSLTQRLDAIGAAGFFAFCSEAASFLSDVITARP